MNTKEGQEELAQMIRRESERLLEEIGKSVKRTKEIIWLSRYCTSCKSFSQDGSRTTCKRWNVRIVKPFYGRAIWESVPKKGNEMEKERGRLRHRLEQEVEGDFRPNRRMGRREGQRGLPVLLLYSRLNIEPGQKPRSVSSARASRHTRRRTSLLERSQPRMQGTLVVLMVHHSYCRTFHLQWADRISDR